MADSAAALPQAWLENGLGLAAKQPRYDGPEQLARRALAVVERGRRDERSYRGSRPQASLLDRDQRGHEHDHGERDDHPPR
jgi:hypothetical protein